MINKEEWRRRRRSRRFELANWARVLYLLLQLSYTGKKEKGESF